MEIKSSSTTQDLSDLGKLFEILISLFSSLI